VNIWYQVEGRDEVLLGGFTGQYVDELLKKIKEKSQLVDSPDTLQPFVKRQESDEEISLRELENMLGRNETLNFGDLVSKYDIWNKNPIIIRLPGLRRKLTELGDGKDLQNLDKCLWFFANSYYGSVW
ncbi:hypothetical protein BC938DRAFT_475336, partial [Jimgerdemannia flammicorona]